DAVLAPAVGARAGLVVRKVVPGAAAGAVVLAHRPPGALGEVRAPALPVRRPHAGLGEPTLFFGHASSLRCRRAPVPVYPPRPGAVQAGNATLAEVPSMPSLARLHDLVASLTSRLAFLPPVLARLGLGIVFIGTGWGKLHSLEQVTQFFTELHIPAPGIMAPYIAGLE